jgi:hypothetical protein
MEKSPSWEANNVTQQQRLWLLMQISLIYKYRSKNKITAKYYYTITDNTVLWKHFYTEAI